MFTSFSASKIGSDVELIFLGRKETDLVSFSLVLFFFFFFSGGGFVFKPVLLLTVYLLNGLFTELLKHILLL